MLELKHHCRSVRCRVKCRRHSLMNRRPAGAGKRHRNEQSLAEAIAKVLKKDKPMGIQQVVDAVLASGYKSTAKNFKTVVSLNLSKDKRFKNAARGQYVLNS